jgi:hypothetical protein
LLAVAGKNNSANPSLAFVHIMKEDGDEKECHGDKGEEVDNSDEDDDNGNDDEEFEMEDDDGDGNDNDNDDGIDNHKADSVGEKATSDEEFEFE